MIRFLFRFLGLLSLALGFIFLVYDGTKSIADQRIVTIRVREIWEWISETSLASVEPALKRLAPWLWDPLATSVLNSPGWLVLVILGTVLILLGRKKKPLIGYARD